MRAYAHIHTHTHITGVSKYLLLFFFATYIKIIKATSVLFFVIKSTILVSETLSLA